jgi:hypothetical protein
MATAASHFKGGGKGGRWNLLSKLVALAGGRASGREEGRGGG